MATKRNRFENGVSNGSNVTTTNSDDTGDDAFSVANGTRVYDNTHVAHGAQSMKSSNATTSNPDIVGFSDSAATDFAASGYFYLTGYPSAGEQFGIRCQTSGAAAGEKAYVTAAGKLELVQPGGTVRVTSSGTSVPLNQWVRIDFWGTGLNSASTVLNAAWADMDSSTDGDSITTGTITTSVDVAEIRFGKNGAITVADWWLDDVRANIGTGTRLSPSQEYLTDSDSGTFDDSDTTHTVDDLVDTGTFTETSATLTISGSGPALPPKDTTRLVIDWDGDGWEDRIDDMTDYVRGAVTATYGRSEPSAMSPVTAGSASFSAANQPHPTKGARFSPRNTLSPLYGKIRPARPFLWQRQITGLLRTIFRGQTDSSPINPDVDSRQVTFRCIDVLATFRGKLVTTPVYQGIWPGDAIGYVLDALGWDGPRDIDKGATIFPFWWCDGKDALDALQEIVASEGCPSLLTVDGNGAVSFRGRHHRETEQRSTVSQGTWTGDPDAAEPVMSGLTYDEAWDSVVNAAALSVDERQVGLAENVWSTDDTIAFDIGEARTFLVQTTDPFVNAVAPRDGIEYQVLSGSFTDVTISRTSGASTSITMTAGEDGASIQGLALFANPVAVRRTYRIEETDSASITVYGERGLPDGMTPVWAGKHDAKAILEIAVRDRAAPLTQLTVRFVCGVNDTARLKLVTGYDLSDRVTVVEPITATSADFFIESISHVMTFAGHHEVTFGLEAAPPASAAPFILDSSVLDTGVLGP